MDDRLPVTHPTDAFDEQPADASTVDPVTSFSTVADTDVVDTTLSTSPASHVAPSTPATTRNHSRWTPRRHEVIGGLRALFSAGVYATLIVTFGFQVARVDGRSMAPTLEDHDRLIVNKLMYELGDPLPGDIVMLYYPVNP